MGLKAPALNQDGALPARPDVPLIDGESEGKEGDALTHLQICFDSSWVSLLTESFRFRFSISSLEILLLRGCI